jgi:hypothetical protein
MHRCECGRVVDLLGNTLFRKGAAVSIAGSRLKNSLPRNLFYRHLSRQARTACPLLLPGPPENDGLLAQYSPQPWNFMR